MPNKKLKIETEAELLKSQLVRALADYDNLVKRVEREREDLRKIVSQRIILKFTDVLDGLDRAQEHLKNQGLAISIAEFRKVINEEGYIEINPKVGEKFDENTMEAVERVPSTEDGISVKEVLMKGLKFEDGKIIKPAKVKVYQKFIVE